MLESSEEILCEVTNKLEREFQHRFTGTGEVRLPQAGRPLPSSHRINTASLCSCPQHPCAAPAAQVNPMTLSQRIRRLQRDLPALKQQCQAVMSSKQVHKTAPNTTHHPPLPSRLWFPPFRFAPLVLLHLTACRARPPFSGAAGRSAQAADFQPGPAHRAVRTLRVRPARRLGRAGRTHARAVRARRAHEGERRRSR